LQGGNENVCHLDEVVVKYAETNEQTHEKAKGIKRTSHSNSEDGCQIGLISEPFGLCATKWAQYDDWPILGLNHDL